jgi:hypothetical protein
VVTGGKVELKYARFIAAHKIYEFDVRQLENVVKREDLELLSAIGVTHVLHLYGKTWHSSASVCLDEPSALILVHATIGCNSRYLEARPGQDVFVDVLSNKLYKRVTYHDLGRSEQRGLSMVQNSRKVLFLKDISIYNDRLPEIYPSIHPK